MLSSTKTKGNRVSEHHGGSKASWQFWRKSQADTAGPAHGWGLPRWRAAAVPRLNEAGGKGQAVSGFHTRPRTPESLSPWGNCQGRVARCAPRPGRACRMSASVSQTGLASQGLPGPGAVSLHLNSWLHPGWVRTAPLTFLWLQTEGTGVTEITEKAPGGGQEIWL